MFGLDTWEILIIVIVLVVVLKPKDLPKIVRLVGKIVGRIRYLYARVEETVMNMEQQVDGDRDVRQRTTMKHPVGAGQNGNGRSSYRKKDIGRRKADGDSVRANPGAVSQEGNHDRNN